MLRIVMIITVLLTGCSAQQSIEHIPAEQFVSAQERILKQLYLGKSKQDVLKLITYPRIHTFDVIEGASIYSYIEAINVDTNVNIGLYFKDDTLQSVMLDDDVSDLLSCRTLFKTNGKHWLSAGITPYHDWIKSKDQLITGLNFRINHPKKTTEKTPAHTAIANTLTLIMYSPALLVAAPFMIHDEVTGKTEDEQKTITTRYELASTIQLGETEEHILGQLGQPEQTHYVIDANVLTYNGPSYSYGIKDGIVVWIEHFSMFELYTRQFDYGDVLYGKTDCGSLDAF
ncbi:hypothetical protein [Shewanella litoralis]|uniref:DUF3298 domain-containing protein n=1 Tax=Shewanella litoralis TaxID=2282700 RepID=A0ABQ2R0I6_9GAMM|nr:hypothetical protein [Shewanella litoralis]GGQ06381.1 hypothetical protein GCM10009411_04090 [Shewanella litoralis]